MQKYETENNAFKNDVNTLNSKLVEAKLLINELEHEKVLNLIKNFKKKALLI